MRRQAKSLESQDAWMFILNERIIANNPIEVLKKGGLIRESGLKGLRKGESGETRRVEGGAEKGEAEETEMVEGGAERMRS